MSTNINTISTLISDFRALQAKDSISPEAVGYLMQRILDAVADVSAPDNSAELASIRDFLDKLAKAGSVFTHLNVSPGTSEISYSPTVVSLATGKTSYSTKSVFIPRATASSAGVMSASDAVALANAKSDIASLKQRVDALVTAGSADNTPNTAKWTHPIVGFDGFQDPPADAVFTESPYYATIQWLHLSNFTCRIVFSNTECTFLRVINDLDSNLTYWSREWDAEQDYDGGGCDFPGSSLFKPWEDEGSLKLYFNILNGGVYHYNSDTGNLENLIVKSDFDALKQRVADLEKVLPQPVNNAQ